MCKDGSASGGDNTAGECAKSGSNKTGLKSALGDQGKDKWPKISHASGAYGKDSTEQISGEMTGLKTEEKGTVAGLFARTVEENTGICSVVASLTKPAFLFAEFICFV